MDSYLPSVEVPDPKDPAKDVLETGGRVGASAGYDDSIRTPEAMPGKLGPRVGNFGPDPATKIDAGNPRYEGGAGVNLGDPISGRTYNLSLISVKAGGGGSLFDGVGNLFLADIRELAHIAVEKYQRWRDKNAA